ncbi:hypothetical protein [Streptomyces sp. NPDC088246]
MTACQTPGFLPGWRPHLPAALYAGRRPVPATRVREMFDGDLAHTTVVTC